MAFASEENGSVMLFVVLFIFMVTVMGMVAMKVSVYEIKISENNRRYNEEITSAEAALNYAVANFRKLKDDVSDASTGDDNTKKIARVLNDKDFGDYTLAYYLNPSEILYPGTTSSVAKIEVRRVVSSTGDVSELSDEANAVPRLPHRYYAGSIDKRRFAITATAYRKGTSTPSTTWVQKGISLPAEQDKDLF